MSTLNAQDISLYYETHGDPEAPPVLLLSGLGGVGASWGTQIARFAEKYHVILPDQRGTGRTTRALNGYTTRQLAADMASLVEELGVGPVHVVGASTGGAIAQYMALERPRLVRSLTLSSTFARFDAFTRREFEVRRRLAAEWDRRDLLSGYSLFLFGPRYTREHPEAVVEWIDRAAALPAHPDDRRIGLARIDMIAAHDAFARLGEITQPTLVLCGEHNFCTPLPLSEELVRGIAGATLTVFEEAGELIELEQPVRFFTEVSGFIDGLRDPARGLRRAAR
ncbi:alpha/beta hydrolase [Sphaerisporangium sp. NPDC051017]|uniref:alpha/beta fold hydrolase n=1 Tax=Sphaerisporangium sp. NPDC051017 TaxID=3154636 RepID=UPI003412A829